jgi:hypothetical protein
VRAIEEDGMAWKLEGQHFENYSFEGGSGFANPFAWGA